MTNKPSLADRLAEVRQKIAAACNKSGRDVSDVNLVAVTKYAGPEQIREIVKLGVCDLGENKVQQLTQRAAQINELTQRRAGSVEGPPPPKIRWHMIGHLQRNKVKQLAPAAAMIHSVDSLKLAEELDEQMERIGRKLPILVQVNCSEESQKSGVAVGAALHLAEQIATMPNLQVSGLMTMAEFGADDSQARHTFSRLREIYDEMKWQKIGGPSMRHLSMGMTNDYESAILEGSTLIRVGSALFGGEAKADDEQGED